MVTYLMARLRSNWGAAFTAQWERVSEDEAKQKDAYRMLASEYAAVVAGCDREAVNAVIAMARRSEGCVEFPPRPPQLLQLVNTFREEQRRRLAEREQAARRALPAPKVTAEIIYSGRAFLKAFVKCGGNTGRME